MEDKLNVIWNLLSVDEQKKSLLENIENTRFYNILLDTNKVMRVPITSTNSYSEINVIRKIDDKHLTINVYFLKKYLGIE